MGYGKQINWGGNFLRKWDCTVWIDTGKVASMLRQYEKLWRCIDFRCIDDFRNAKCKLTLVTFFLKEPIEGRVCTHHLKSWGSQSVWKVHDLLSGWKVDHTLLSMASLYQHVSFLYRGGQNLDYWVLHSKSESHIGLPYLIIHQVPLLHMGGVRQCFTERSVKLIHDMTPIRTTTLHAIH